jgi:hypothetical protein
LRRDAARIDEALGRTRADRPAAERLRNLYRSSEGKRRRFFQERKLHDMVVEAVQSDWGAVQRHKQTIGDVARHVLRDGRASGEFDPALDEEQAVGALWSTLVPFAHPKVLEQTINTDLEARAHAVADLTIRGLRPL